MNMIINLFLSCGFFAAFGALAHRLMGTGGNLLHLTLIGACGYKIHCWIYNLFDIDSGNPLIFLSLILLGSCLAEWLSWKLQIWLYKFSREYKDRSKIYNNKEDDNKE